MKFSKYLRLALVGVGLAALVACSPKPGIHSDAATYGSGLGARDGITALDMDASYTTEAPRDQIYYFAFDDSSIEPKYIPSIEAQADYLLAHPGARILLTGHTDARGSREYNVALGERRAQRVADIIRLSGVPSSQIRIVSYGKERPQVRGDDESVYQYNRRVELIYEATR